jgi:hypothetical protein
MDPNLKHASQKVTDFSNHESTRRVRLAKFGEISGWSRSKEL